MNESHDRGHGVKPPANVIERQLDDSVVDRERDERTTTRSQSILASSRSGSSCESSAIWTSKPGLIPIAASGFVIQSRGQNKPFNPNKFNNHSSTAYRRSTARRSFSSFFRSFCFFVSFMVSTPQKSGRSSIRRGIPRPRTPRPRTGLKWQSARRGAPYAVFRCRDRNRAVMIVSTGDTRPCRTGDCDNTRNGRAAAPQALFHVVGNSITRHDRHLRWVRSARVEVPEPRLPSRRAPFCTSPRRYIAMSSSSRVLFASASAPSRASASRPLNSACRSEAMAASQRARSSASDKASVGRSQTA